VHLTHLASQGRRDTARIARVLLRGSGTKNDVAEIMLDNGWSSKRRETVIARKKADNQRRKHHAARRSEKLGREILPRIEAEDTQCKFISPLGNHTAAKNAKKDFDILMSGHDLPGIQRPTSIGWPKVDGFMEWMTGNCQFRPGKLRNCYWKRDKQTTKNMPA
jgi:hypothetical protein